MNFQTKSGHKFSFNADHSAIGDCVWMRLEVAPFSGFFMLSLDDAEKMAQMLLKAHENSLVAAMHQPKTLSQLVGDDQ